MFRLVWKTLCVLFCLFLCMFFWCLCFFLVSLFFFCFLGFWFLRITNQIQISPNQICFILPPRHSCEVITLNKQYAKHAQYSLGMCNFPFQVWSLWGCKNMFLEKETIPSNKLCSFPSRAQLDAAGVLWRECYIYRNGVIERIVTYFQITQQ